jgi:hypothetical protein
VLRHSFVIRHSCFVIFLTSDPCLPRCSLGAGGTSDLFLLSNFYFLISSRRQFGDDFFEARIAAERVPEGVQF